MSQSINDVARFSLCSLCAIKLRSLYPEEYHQPFRDKLLKTALKHFQLSPKTLGSMLQFVKDDEFTFLSSLKSNSSNSLKLVEELVLIAISDGSYDARSHYLIINIASLLGIPSDLVEIQCEYIYQLLQQQSNLAAEIDQQQQDEISAASQQQEKSKKIKKYLMIGLASIGGGTLIGVTGGLTAPIVASAFAGVLGGTVVMSTAAAGIVGSLFGVAGAGLTASKMNRRIGDLEEFEFESLNSSADQTSLNITIAISGWISQEGEGEFAKPWKHLRHTKEQYCIRYESKYLLELSQAMDYLLSFVVSYATQEALKYTFLASVAAAIAWPTALISIANIIDNPWDVSLRRSAQAGAHLANVLMSRQQGKRPASLIGFSLGARVIFYCLQELSKHSNCGGLIGDVILLGAPVTASEEQWKPFGRVVAGNIVNGYSTRDWLLKFLYRTSSAEMRVAGLQATDWTHKRLRNIDLTDIVAGHLDYYKNLNAILAHVGVHTAASARPASYDSGISSSLTTVMSRTGSVVEQQALIAGSSSAQSFISSTLDGRSKQQQRNRKLSCLVRVAQPATSKLRTCHSFNKQKSVSIQSMLLPVKVCNSQRLRSKSI